MASLLLVFLAAVFYRSRFRDYFLIFGIISFSLFWYQTISVVKKKFVIFGLTCRISVTTELTGFFKYHQYNKSAAMIVEFLRIKLSLGRIPENLKFAKNI